MLTHDSAYDVAAFTVEKKYQNTDELFGLPVVDFATIENVYPPEEYKMIIPLGNSQACQLRTNCYLEAKQKGYSFINYISSRAITWPDLTIGENCMVFEGTIIQPFTKIGNNVLIRSCVHISHHNTIEDHCFIAARVTLAGAVTIKKYNFLGVNSTIIDGVTINESNLIGAGAVVVKDTEQSGIYVGMPAKRIKDNK